MYPRVIKAPGANTKIKIPSLSPINFKLNKEPDPKISLTPPNIVNAKVNPNPIPIPSNIESKIVFLFANASALARIKQFTTISGI